MECIKCSYCSATDLPSILNDTDLCDDCFIRKLKDELASIRTLHDLAHKARGEAEHAANVAREEVERLKAELEKRDKSTEKANSDAALIGYRSEFITIGAGYLAFLEALAPKIASLEADNERLRVELARCSPHTGDCAVLTLNTQCDCGYVARARAVEGK